MLELTTIFKDKPLIIAGPCSAESENQIINTATALDELNIKIFRAGIWKPRSKPNEFEGVGSIGLKWLQSVKQQTKMLVAIEVANAKHVEEALKANIDIFWIGARTSANPFAVQEIADALKGINIPVMVKNPTNPDVSLWHGNIERIEKSITNSVCAIHRGVPCFTSSIYRNNPEWRIVIELRKQRPDLFYIADPSHIAGNKELIFPISQTALDLKFDGLMIETHIEPEKALSDSKQQITPQFLKQILSKLILKEEIPKGIELQTIEDLRRTINYIDSELIDLICYRMEIVNEIALFKKNNKMTIFQEGRWNELLSKHIDRAKEKNINPEIIIKVFNYIHQESINKQNEIINS